MRVKAFKVVHRMINAKLMRVFEVWNDNAREQVSSKAKLLCMHKIVQRMINATLMQVVKTWRDRTGEEKQMRAKVGNAIDNSFLSTINKILIDKLSIRSFCY
jgi:hypothetical protein